ncbi:MAG: M20/M25/M40 family metallo-hydrolase [Candidatus Eisenbacteria bacterium]
MTAVERRLPAGRALLERSVNMNSGTMNFAGVRAAGALFAPEFAALGFDTTWIDGAAWGRAGHLVVRRAARGSGASSVPRVLLIGHLDTVFERDSPFQRYEAIGDTAARGPGTIDMKGGIVIMLLALGALAETGQLDRFTFEAFLCGDEEKSGKPLALSRARLFEAADSADIALGFEDGDGDPRHAVVARRSATSWRLATSGTSAHSSQVFREDIGSGAIYEMARILAAFRDSLSAEEFLTVNPGVAVGGTAVTLDKERARGTAFGKDNVIAESTYVSGDLRTLTPEQFERAQATMRRIVAASPPHAGASIAFDEGYPPLPPAEGNRRLLAMFDQASLDLGHGPVTATDPARAGAADLSFTAGRTPAALDALGLKGSGGHTVNETADLRTLPVQAKRVAILLGRLSQSGPTRP